MLIKDNTKKLDDSTSKEQNQKIESCYKKLTKKTLSEETPNEIPEENKLKYTNYNE